jgi:hypothetical protein
MNSFTECSGFRGADTPVPGFALPGRVHFATMRRRTARMNLPTLVSPMSRKLKIIIAVILLITCIPVVYYTLAWNNHDPLRFGFAQRHNRESLIAVTNRSAFPVRFRSCYLGSNSRSGRIFFSYYNSKTERDMEFLRPGETRTLAPAQGDISVLEHFGPLTVGYTWQPPGHQPLHDACMWIKGHLPPHLQEKFPEPQYHHDSYAAPLVVEILKPTAASAQR